MWQRECIDIGNISNIRKLIKHDIYRRFAATLIGISRISQIVVQKSYKGRIDGRKILEWRQVIEVCARYFCRVSKSVSLFIRTSQTSSETSFIAFCQQLLRRLTNFDGRLFVNNIFLSSLIELIVNIKLSKQCIPICFTVLIEQQISNADQRTMNIRQSINMKTALSRCFMQTRTSSLSSP